MYWKWLQNQLKVSHEKTSEQESQMICDRIEKEKKQQANSTIVNGRDG